MADFFTETEKLAKKIGDGTLSGVFAVDGGERSIPLEVGGWRDFMGEYGPKDMDIKEPGEAHAVQNSLLETHDISLKDVAATVLETGPQEGMRRHSGRMVTSFREKAPRDTGQYAESWASFIVDNGQLVHQEYGASYGEDPE